MKKKILGILLLGVLVISLTGCSNNSSSNQKEDDYNNYNETDDNSNNVIENNSEAEENNSKVNEEIKNDISFKCSGKVYYAYEELNFNFKYDTSKKDYSLDSVYKNLTIPDGYDPNDFFTSEQISNMGQYEMSLSGNIITFKLDKTRAYWNDYYFKNYSYDDLKNKFTNDGYVCE